MFKFDLNYYDADGEVIYEYESPDSDRMCYAGVYSELLDAVKRGLDTFVDDPLWTDGVNSFDEFEDLVNRDSALIYNVSKIEEAFEIMKESVATMMRGMDIESL